MAIWTAFIAPIASILDKLIPDKDLRQKLKQELDVLEQKGELDVALKQIEVNINEASSSSMFVAGWRPFIGWVCGISFAYHFVLFPIVKTIAAISGLDISGLPIFDLNVMMPVLLGMLGLGGLRSFEKFKGVSRKKM